MTPRLCVSPAFCQTLPGLDLEPFQEWFNDDGSVYLRFYRDTSGYRLRFPDLADFVVSQDGSQVTVHRQQGLTDGTLDHLWLNQVRPLALTRQGHLVLHGSAVDVNGTGVAFLGDSGMGKSTLAASFAVCGTRFLTDDGLLMRRAQDHWLMMPSHPSIRLWEDSEDALVHDGVTRAPAVSYTQKARFLAGPGVAFCPEARPLKLVYVLANEDVTQTAFSSLKPAEALLACVQNSFLLDVKAQDMLARHFEDLTDLTRTTMCFRLDYPRQYDALPMVRRAIEQHVAASLGA